MENCNIIYIGGFAASTNYSEPMCRELQKITLCKVYNFPIHHGLTLYNECYQIYLYFNENKLINYEKPFIIIGFSTGCVIATKLSEFIPTKSIILINPAEVLTRMTNNMLYSVIPFYECAKYSNISSYFSIFDKNFSSRNDNIKILQKVKQYFYIFSWKSFWKIMSWNRWIAIKLFGPKTVASYYYKYYGSKCNEPHISELMKSLFSPKRNFFDMLKTIVECLIKPNLYKLINNSKVNKIHIIQGKQDKLYIPYANLLFNYNKKILYHQMTGNHHMIYHHPIETANKISAVLYN